jgi:hypothetical protein
MLLLILDLAINVWGREREIIKWRGNSETDLIFRGWGIEKKILL